MSEEKDSKETKPKASVKKTVKKEAAAGEEKPAVKKAKAPTTAKKKTTKEGEEPEVKKVEEVVSHVPTPVPAPIAFSAEEKPVVIKAKPEVVRKVVIEKTSGTAYLGTGRRKTSIARVRLTPGKGQVIINGLHAQQYFRHKRLDAVLAEPFFATQTNGRFDTTVSVDGGGLMSQAGAVRHGISRALLNFDEAFRKPLRAAGLLTRDPRMVERKKFGRAGARKRFQFSKR